jgi:membrane associated rhomboid family serine protease
MARPSPLAGSFVVLGSRVPKVVGLLIGLTLGASIVGAVGSRNGLGAVIQSAALVPALVMGGQAWRLFTWVFFELEPLNLVFACLAFFWFGRDLALAWGPGRFLVAYFALAGLTGAVVCLLALLFPSLLMGFGHIGPWALVDGMIVTWALLYPHRDVFVYFVLPLRGRNLIYATVGGTVLFALLGGVTRCIPYFVAEGLALLYMREPFWETWLLRLRFNLKTRSWRRRASHLRPVDRAGSDEPPKWLH